ncbi:hypothetical protein BDW02DRAFT_9634 [Decorospora gaudefroyi]|uniref:Uncharacterized protein n=1 Tax=Decorospora gaudefroyi TaxID=184978 RepID=A0A6A5KU79_9PLEO|nr:hypothetical protein BDW02DRAFT_9634 [Decorospora gaudefroyi]
MSCSATTQGQIVFRIYARINCNCAVVTGNGVVTHARRRTTLPWWRSNDTYSLAWRTGPTTLSLVCILHIAFVGPFVILMPSGFVD